MLTIPRPTLILIMVLTVVVALLGWNYFAQPFASRDPDTNQVSATPSPTSASTPETASFVPEQAVAQVLAYPVVVTNASVGSSASASATLTTPPSVLSSDDVAWITQYHPALVTLFGTKISTTSARLAVGEIRAAYDSKQVVIAVDHEGGTSQRLNGTGFTVLPAWRTLCNQDAEVAGTMLGTSFSEVKQAGIDMILAPVVDVGTSAIMASRMCSSEPEAVVQNATRFVTLAQERGLVPVLKHFPGIGSITRDLHTSFDQVTITAQDARVYQQLLAAFPKLAVMATHVGVSNQYGEIPCSLSADCVGELKNNFPQTLVLADALEMNSAARIPAVNGAVATSSATLTQRAIAAITAGDQILLFGQAVTPAQMTEVYQGLLQEYQANPTFKTQLDLAATRVLELQRSVAGSE